MATVSNFALRLPPSLMEDVKALATQDAVSVNQFLVQAAAEKVATLKARGYLAERGRSGGVGRSRPRAGEIPERRRADPGGTNCPEDWAGSPGAPASLDRGPSARGKPSHAAFDPGRVAGLGTPHFAVPFWMIVSPNGEGR